ncbi:MAG TPA: hypothetical protein DIT64_01275 [Verrucomicrobiales bacterium]|nr:hypothetical protein [Verrucomicrobiales bacterium]
MSSKTCQPAGHATDLTDAQWALIEPFLFPAGAKRGRGRRRQPHAARACLDAIRHLLKAGCQWSLPPGEFPPKSTGMTPLRPGPRKVCGRASTLPCAGGCALRR